MDWQIGQRLMCDRNGQLLTDCVVQARDHDSIVIFCASVNIVVCGKQKSLEELGWQTNDLVSVNPSSANKTY
ncbi:MAG: hypothetical protein SFY66_12385 [Oculatellaceae cyanobacterium bins.114]|nr:hypothetical protein [Oculatellaceae cyanobacterium bins.114]